MKKSIKPVVIAGLTASVYVALTYLSALLGIAYGQVQFRLSEALCILPVFCPSAVWGLTVGCFIGNIGSPLGPVDWLIGAFSTFLSAFATRKLGNVRIKGVPFLAPLPCVIINAVAVAAQTAVLFADKSARMSVFLSSAAFVAIGQTAVCYGLGLPLFIAINKSPLKKMLDT